jgi:hypothetical protein
MASVGKDRMKRDGIVGCQHTKPPNDKTLGSIVARHLGIGGEAATATSMRGQGNRRRQRAAGRDGTPAAIPGHAEQARDHRPRRADDGIKGCHSMNSSIGSIARRIGDGIESRESSARPERNPRLDRI